MSNEPKDNTCEASLQDHILAIAAYLQQGGVSPFNCAHTYPAMVEIAEAYRIITGAAPYTSTIAVQEFERYQRQGGRATEAFYNFKATDPKDIN